MIYDRLENIKQAGQSIINNAESILGNEEYRGSIKIVVRLDLNEPPVIKVIRSFYPETFIETLKTED